MSLTQLKTQSEQQATSPYSPILRPRRLRSSDAMRRLVRETVLTANDFIYPIFVDEGLSEPQEVSSMPGVWRQTEKSMETLLKQVDAAKVPAVMLFGVSNHKDHEGTDSFRKGGLMDRMVKRAKDTCPDLVIMADACFCEYTDHGHCGPLDHVHNDVDNDRTIANIALQAVTAAEAGADVIAPSGMMDGQVAAIRAALDESGCERTAILAYAAKYASGFYGPFRDALDSAPKKGDKKTYQMDFANAREALREAELDEAEGADILMVKPGLPYLDVILRLKEHSTLPIAAYNVSGEYAMVKAAAQNGWLDENKTVIEVLTSFRRAGADIILTYHAKLAAQLLKK